MALTTGLMFLAASVTCSVAVGALIKAGRSRGLDVRQAIFMNYIVASLLCLGLLRPDLGKLLSPGQPVLFFLALARSVQTAGIVRTDAAQRLSLVIPLLAAFALFGEALTSQKLLGMGLAFGALICLLCKPAGRSSHYAADGSSWLWPLLVLLGYGVIDILFKQMARAGAAFSGGLLAVFVLAGLLMLLYLLLVRVRWGGSHLLTGVLLGALNFANIYTYIRAHQSLPGNPSLVFSAMNMGVIVLGTLVGALLFRERLSKLNLLGVLLALGAIAALMPR